MTMQPLRRPDFEALPAQRQISPEQSHRDDLYDYFEEYLQSEGLQLAAVDKTTAATFATLAHNFVAVHAHPLAEAAIQHHTESVSRQAAETAGPPRIGVVPAGMVRNKLRTILTQFNPMREDRVIRRQHTNLRMDNTPAAHRMKERFPEIGFAYELKERLRAHGNEAATDAMNDVLAAYGMVIRDLGRAAAQRAQERGGY